MDEQEVVTAEQQEVQTEEVKEEKNFTQDQVNSLLAKEKAKLERRYTKELEEVKKLSTMKEDEQANYLQKQKEEELTQKEQELLKRELVANAKEILTDRGLPHELHKVLNYTDEDSVAESIETLEKAIQKTVELKVAERLKGNAPVGTKASNTRTSLQDEVFKNMGIK